MNQDMQQSKTHWPSILTLIAIIPGAGLLLITALGFGVSSIVSLATDSNDPVGIMIASFSTAMEGLILVVAIWFVLQKTLGRAGTELSIKLPFANWQILVALAVVGIALLSGGLISFSGIKWLGLIVLPVLTILVIASPIWVLLGLGTNGLEFGPRWRSWSIFGLAMTLGPLIMITLEFLLVIILIVVAALYLATKPGMVEEITKLATVLQNETKPEVIIKLISPYIVNRGVITMALLFFALAIPMIEELFKPLGIWLFASKIQTPTQGFALGLLSGAAYALVESLGVSGQGDKTWALVVSVRAGTSLLHITTTGLMGWAIINAWRSKRFLNLLLMYATVVIIHGIWNGAVVGTSLATLMDMGGETHWTFTIVPALICGMAVLGVGMPAVLLASNRKVKQLSSKESSASEILSEKDLAQNTGVK